VQSVPKPALLSILTKIITTPSCLCKLVAGRHIKATNYSHRSC